AAGPRARDTPKYTCPKYNNGPGRATNAPAHHPGRVYLGAANAPAAGGGYELALACDWITLIDARRSAVSLPEVALLAVLPGTGGPTRLTRKRKGRRDRAGFFFTSEERLGGRRAGGWRPGREN